ncbi:MAG: dephospho-CoA kinase [Acholeplasmataceae bacterium]|nr:dephospho-CoA kinase [Acholeplasmataceae bacterium]MDD4203652.1 dephospho-CoA kinase [Acholeplasmataceae bacterium]MDD4468433.1 dephospho-CoA kinase [Acholeplasmataceae bacterium]
MLKVGITGSIGSGKTLASNFFKELGYKVLDADQINQRLLKTEAVIRKINRSLFNQDSNSLDKTLIKDIIFKDETKKKTLENILHPIIYQMMEEELKSLEKEEIVFIDVPLLFEAGFDKLTDYNIVIYTSEEQQVNRITIRDKIDKNTAILRIKGQWDIKEKMGKSDYVINNDESVEDTYQQLNDWLSNFKKVGQGYLNEKKVYKIKTKK